jgi:hypothetical protein
MIALTREPSARRASTIGEDSSTRRPIADRRRGEAPVALDEDLLVGIDQNVGDRVVLQERLERPEPEEFVEDFVDQLVALAQVERPVFLDQQLADHLADLPAKLLGRHLVDDRKIEHVEQALVQRDLEVGQLRGRFPARRALENFGAAVLDGLDRFVSRN